MDRRGQASAYPVQQRLAARPKNALLAALATFLVVFVFMNMSKVDTVVAGGRQAAANVGELAHNVHVPDRLSRPFANLHNPFKPGAHPPPEQANSTSGETSWFADWKWLNPFSSTVTLDEDRALLPPVVARPPVYTYYEPRDREKDGPLAQAEIALLDVWRRAWWAQGFRPVILGPRDAMENPLYEKVHMVGVKSKDVTTDLMRLLAWSHMGDGILANWLLVPMASYYSPLLVYLRQARYQKLTRYQDLGMGLFAGPKEELDNAINTLLAEPGLETAESLSAVISQQEALFEIETRRKGVAFYTDEIVKKNYGEISSVLVTSTSKGYKMLASLITGHLQAMFLEQYPEGISVVSPFAKNATLVPHRALAFATVLNTCPGEMVAPNRQALSPITTCPPNAPNCRTCAPLPIAFPAAAPASNKTFTVGTVPHSYTLTRLLAPHSPTFNFSLAYIRRGTARDPFTEAVTAETTAGGISAYERIVHLKERIAQPGKGAMRSVWRHAEADWSWDALEWRLGFALPRPGQPDRSDAMGDPIPQVVISDIDVPDVPEGLDGKYPDELEPLLASMDGEGKGGRPERSDVSEQSRIMRHTAEQLGRRKWTGPPEHDLRKVAEAWNLADIEAWKFVRALAARDEVERVKWMEEERRYKP